MENINKELKVSALENGTVLDHIPAENVYKALDILGLKGIGNQITIGINLNSKLFGKKGIIKIADRFFQDEELNKEFPGGGEKEAGHAARDHGNSEMHESEMYHEPSACQDQIYRSGRRRGNFTAVPLLRKTVGHKEPVLARDCSRYGRKYPIHGKQDRGTGAGLR